MTPSRIGKYEIHRRLGVGGMGALYLARDPDLDRLVAIKLLKDEVQDDPDLRQRFVREARSVARVRHPNIIVVFEIGETDGRPFIAMEYVAGETLTHVLRRRPVPSLTTRLGMMEELCAGLAHAHGASIIHRDIKPANLMIDHDGVLKILDFGIARLGNSAMTQDGMMMGTVNYMSPEQVVGRGVDHRTDIFAAGAVLYELIALEQAFPGRLDTGVLNRILNDGPVPLEERVSDVDPDLASIVRRALAREPANRYQDAAVLRREVARVRRRLIEAGEPAEENTSVDPTRVVRSRPTPRPTPRPSAGRQEEESDRYQRLTPSRLAELRREQLASHMRLGEEAFAQGRFAEAVQHAERAATVDPDSHAPYALIERARVASSSDEVRTVLTAAERYLAEGALAEAESSANRAQALAAELPDVPELRTAVRRTAERIAAAIDRAHRIDAALNRAEILFREEGFEDALRAVSEALVLDPEQAEAVDLQQRIESALAAQEQQARARDDAYARLKDARRLAAEGQFDAAVQQVAAIEPVSDSIYIAAAQTAATIERLRRESECRAIVAGARSANTRGEFEASLNALDGVPQELRTPEWQSAYAAADEALRKEREAERRREALEAVLTGARRLIGRSELDAAQQQLEQSQRQGLDDARVAELLVEIRDRKAAAEERRRQEERDRQANAAASEARRLLESGNSAAALTVLEAVRSEHPVVLEALGEVRAAVEAERREAARLAEAQRRAEEARRKAEREEAERREAARRAEEQQRAEEARLKAEREEAERQEAARRAEEQRQAEEARLEAEREEAERQEAARRAEEQQRAEEARLKAKREEAERLEAARRAEEQRRAEEARLKIKREEAERQEAARLAEEQRLAEEARLKAEREDTERREAARRADEQRRAEDARRKAERDEAARKKAKRQEAARRAEAERLPKDTPPVALADASPTVLRSPASDAPAAIQGLTQATPPPTTVRRPRYAAIAAAVALLIGGAAWGLRQLQTGDGPVEVASSQPEQVQPTGVTPPPESAPPTVRAEQPASPAAQPPLEAPASTGRAAVPVPASPRAGAPPTPQQTRPPNIARGTTAAAADRPTSGGAREQTPANPANADQRLRDAEDQAARDQAARDQASRDQAARDQAARDEAARVQAARDAAAREAARPSASDQVARDRAAIEELVRQYADAYTRLDEARLKAIDPTFRGIERKDLIRSVELSFSQRSIDISSDGQSARVAALGTFAYVWRRAGFPASTPARLTWTLRKTGTTWAVVP